MSSKVSVLKFKFEDFESLPSDRDQCKDSDRVTDCHGNPWRLCVYPGGTVESEVGMVGIFLINEGANTVNAAYNIILRNAASVVYYEQSFLPVQFGDGSSGKNMLGTDDFIQRSEILDKENNILLHGALLADVIILETTESTSFYTPPNPAAKNLLTLLEQEEDSDVTFKIDETNLPAHKLILKLNAPVLYEFCKGNPNGNIVPIKDITPQAFRIVLRYAYGGEMPNEKIILLDDNGKEIIDAANRFGVISLKLAVEAVLVEYLAFDVDSVADWIVFAESKTCPLLKEHAMAYFAACPEDILDSKSSDKLKQSPELLTELIRANFRSSKNTDTRLDNPESNMSVNELRKKLNEKGMDVDGSKETLISRLQGANKRQRTE